MPVELDVVYHNAVAQLDVRVVENPAYRGGRAAARYYVEWSPPGRGQWQRVGYTNSFEQATHILEQYLQPPGRRTRRSRRRYRR